MATTRYLVRKLSLNETPAQVGFESRELAEKRACENANGDPHANYYVVEYRYLSLARRRDAEVLRIDADDTP